MLRRFTILLGAAAAFGCQQPAPAQPTRPAGHYLYILDATQGEIGGYRLDDATGAMSLMADHQWILGMLGVRRVTMAPGGLYGFMGTSSFTIPIAYSPDGALNARPEGQLPGALPVAVVHPSGKFLYSSGATGLELHTLKADGLPNQPLVASYQVTATDASIDPSGRLLLSLNKPESWLDVFTIDQATGRLTKLPGSPPHGDGYPLDSARLHPNGMLAFALSPAVGPSHMAVFLLGSDGIAPVVGSPFVLARDARAFALSPDGRFVLVVHKATHLIAVYAIDDAGGMHPVAGSPFNAATGPEMIEVDAGGHFLYIGYPDTGTASVFTIDSHGAVAPVPGSTVRMGLGRWFTSLVVPPVTMDAARLPQPDSPGLLPIDLAAPDDPDYAERLAAANAPPKPKTYPPEKYRPLRLICDVLPDGGEYGTHGAFVSNLKSIKMYVDLQGMRDELPAELTLKTSNQASLGNSVEITALPLAVSNNPAPAPTTVSVSETSSTNFYGLRLGLLLDIPMPDAYATKSVDEYVKAHPKMSAETLKTLFKENQTGPFELTCTYHPKGAALDKTLTGKARFEVVNSGKFFQQPAFK